MDLLGGGKTSPFNNMARIYIMYIPSSHKIVLEKAATIRRIILQDPTINVNNLKLYNDTGFHFTIFDFQINLDNPNNYIFFTKEFKNFILDSFKKKIMNKNLTFKKMGVFSRFYAANYELDNNSITPFRINFYNYIENELNKQKGFLKINKKEVNQEYTFSGKTMYEKWIVFDDLFAIRDYNFGNNNFTAHMSILKIFELKGKNISYFDEIHDFYKKNESDKILSKLNSKLNIIDKQFSNIQINDKDNIIISTKKGSNDSEESIFPLDNKYLIAEKLLDQMRSIINILKNLIINKKKKEIKKNYSLIQYQIENLKNVYKKFIKI